ncbi:MAG: LemA family protein, partial [Oscillospiraceae bacterium]
MITLIVLAVLLILVVSWGMSTQRRLVVLDENINNAMSQIGVQLSSRFDALSALLDLTKGY